MAACRCWQLPVLLVSFFGSPAPILSEAQDLFVHVQLLSPDIHLPFCFYLCKTSPCCDLKITVNRAPRYRLVLRPRKNDTTASTRNTRNRICAMLDAPPAIPPKPSTAAMMAITKKVIAQLSIVLSSVASAPLVALNLENKVTEPQRTENAFEKSRE